MRYPIQGKIRWGQIVLVLIIGLGIGSLTPWLETESKTPSVDSAAGIPVSETLASENPGVEDYYFCRIEEGKTLSIYQGLPTLGGQDEVQSFIDSMSEELWLE